MLDDNPDPHQKVAWKHSCCSQWQFNNYHWLEQCGLSHFPSTRFRHPGQRVGVVIIESVIVIPVCEVEKEGWLLDFSLLEARCHIPLIELLRRLIAGRICRRVWTNFVRIVTPLRHYRRCRGFTPTWRGRFKWDVYYLVSVVNNNRDPLLTLSIHCTTVSS